MKVSQVLFDSSVDTFSSAVRCNTLECTSPRPRILTSAPTLLAEVAKCACFSSGKAMVLEAEIRHDLLNKNPSQFKEVQPVGTSGRFMGLARPSRTPLAIQLQFQC